MEVKVIIVDDHKILREGLRSLIEKEPGMTVIAESANGRTAFQLARRLNPNVVVMDINMPDMNGIEATRHIVAEFPDVKVIALSMHSDRRFVVEMLKAGVSGYLLKDVAFEELGNAIRTVMDNRNYLCPKIAKIVLEDYKEHLLATEPSAMVALTSREREVLQLIAEGRSTRQIGDRLNVSIKTVETHRRNIMDKLNIFTIAELTKFAIRQGLTSLEP